MRRNQSRSSGKWFIVVMILLVIVWPSYQIYKLMGGNVAKEDAGRMLYEVAAFQMGLVQNALNEASTMKNASQLDAVKLAIYSANYTHDRLVKAYDNDHLKRLASLNKLLEFITSVQIAGDRSLHEEEKRILQEVQRRYGEFYEAYEQLVTGSGQLVSSEAVIVSEADEAMQELLEKQMNP
ncbi:hypothetical protein [Paenibacillus guangzhouensis]|uniref:hypothetical protein n=1 Tax=Paenibacillus guangzhouensis TaxID=1473112 RepID=UPI001266D400|nr:hypothetical protein [Paenibacillus guangzhouensis]